MSIGTPFLAAHAVAAAGSTTLVASVSTSVAGGDGIAVWVTTNTSTNNISTVTDSQGNAYTPSTEITGTTLNGQWFVSANISPLVAGTDTITLTCTGTGGTKTVQAIACPGLALANVIDQHPVGTSGTSTAPSQTLPSGTANNELVLMGEANGNPGGAITLTSSFAGATVLDSQHTGSAQFSQVAANVLTTAAAQTASGTLSASTNWIVASISLLPQVVNSNNTGLVGCTTPTQAFIPPPSGQSPCYDFAIGITDQEAADNKFVAAVSRSLPNGKLSFTKKFWNEGEYQTSGVRANDMAGYLNFGTKVLFALFPPHLNYTAADQTALANFLTFIKGLGFNQSNCHILLWQEPEIGNKFGNANNPFPLGAAGFQAGMTFFGPTVLASGLPLVMDIGMGQGVPGVMQYLNAGVAALPAGSYQAIYVDFYFGAYNASGIIADGRLNQPAAFADGLGVEFGLGEFGCHVTDNYQGYFNYITGFFQSRLAANKKNGNLGWYQGQCSLTGAGDLSAPIMNSTDPRVPFYQAMFDTLTSPPNPNTIQVTNPGAQTGTAGTPIAPLTITATDSDPTQTLTFTATGLPTGLSISSAGVITGTPAAQSTNSVTVTATDGTGASGHAGFTWTISPIVTNTVTITNPGSQQNPLGAVVSLQMAGTDSNPSDLPLAWSAGGLPTGLSINAGTGLITGTPTQLGAFTPSVAGVDTIGSSGSTSFTWTITNPNILPAGKFFTLPPANPSPIAGLAPAEELSYEIAFGITAGASSTLPFCAVTITFYDFDELPSLQTPVDIVTFRVPMGTVGDPNGPAIVYGKGPQRGAFMRIQCHNVDTVDATLAFMQVVGTARTVSNHDWRWDSGGNAPVIPGYTNATSASASLVLGGLSNLSTGAGGTSDRLCSMFAGKVWFRAHLNNGGPASVGVAINPQPPSLFSSQSVYNETISAGNEITQELALPRGPCTIHIDNAGGASAAVVSAELIAIVE